MPVRLATSRDIPIMASVLSAAFGPDSLFAFLFPHQDRYPQDMESAMREGLWLSYYDVKKVLMVSYEAAEADERQPLIGKGNAHGTGGGRVTGLAEWERGVNGRGAGHVNGFWGAWDPRRLMKPLLSTFYRLRRLFITNRAALVPSTPSPLTYWTLGPFLGPLVEGFMSAPHRQKHWSLEILGVHPDEQGKGYGKELVQDGLQRFAQSDPEGDVPAVVVSADGKEEFYRKCGFPELLGWVSEVRDEFGNENELKKNGVGGGAVLWTR